MNQQAVLDGLLAMVALWAAWRPGSTLPALRLGAALIGVAALLGALRFSGLLPLPSLHQSMTMFSAGVGLPLLGAAMVWPGSVVAQQRRYAWIFAIAAAVLCVLVTVMAGRAAWPPACALVAVVAMVLASLWRRQWWGMAAGAGMLVAFAAFATKMPVGPLAPGDVLHLGLALSMLMYARWTESLPAGAGAGTRAKHPA